MRHILSIFLPLSLLAVSCGSEGSIDDQFMKDWSFWSDANPKKVSVDLPHDAMQTYSRSADASGGDANAYFPGGMYYYEKTLNLSKEEIDANHYTLDFEGVYQHTKVYVNSEEAGGCEFGYGEFEVIMDDYLIPGDNVIRVVADNSKAPNSRWYSGGGIYRPVRLLVQDKDAYIEDVRVETVSIDPAKVKVTASHKGGDVKATIIYNGKNVASLEGDSGEITVPYAKLWTAETPNLYSLKVDLYNNGKLVETREEEFGIRMIEWSSEGFKVNGKTVLLQGGCIHHDNGVLGTAEYDEAALRRIEIMKSYGFNAVRSAHNPTSKAILKACDRLGMYVLDELGDTWFDKKNPYDYGNYFMDNYPADIASMVRKDFNHPSVVMYSIGNEVNEPSKPEGREVEKSLVDNFHSLDPTRPVTAGFNLMIMFFNNVDINVMMAAESSEKDSETKVTSNEFNEMASMGNALLTAMSLPVVDDLVSPGFDLLDIAGYNYASQRYALDKELHPDRIILGSETMAGGLSENWDIVKSLDNVIGDFMWTGWDYIGEVGIGGWYYADEEGTFKKNFPWVLADTGALDILGNPNGEALLAKAVWLHDDMPYIGVCPISHLPLIKASWRGTNSIPSWSWEGCEGMSTNVEVYTSAKKVRLYLNDNLLGEKDVENHCAIFPVEYQSGTLKAVSVSEDGEEHTAVLKSATGSHSIRITPEKKAYSGKILYVDIDLVGDNGEIIANADEPLHVDVKGATLLGFGSALPYTEERFQTGTYSTYRGQAQAVLLKDTPGKATISVSGEGLQTVTEKISFK